MTAGSRQPMKDNRFSHNAAESGTRRNLLFPPMGGGHRSRISRPLKKRSAVVEENVVTIESATGSARMATSVSGRERPLSPRSTSAASGPPASPLPRTAP